MDIDEMLDEIDFVEEKPPMDDIFFEEPTEKLNIDSLDDFDFDEEPKVSNEPNLQDSMDDLDDLFFSEEPKKKSEPKVVKEQFVEDFVEEPIEEPVVEEPIIREIIEEKHVEKKEEPIVKKPKKTVESKQTETLLETIDGEVKTIRKFSAKEPIPASMNIARETENGYELIAIAPTKIIPMGASDTKLLILDHILKTQKLSAKDKRTMLEYEFAKQNDVKKLFGMSVAELNGMTEEELNNSLIVVSKETSEMVEKLSKELGIKIPITPEIAKAKSETEIMKILLKKRG